DFFLFSSRRRHTRWPRDWCSDVCSSDLTAVEHPYALAVAMVDLDLDGLSELAALRELQPIVLHLVRIGRRIGIGGLAIAAVAGEIGRASCRGRGGKGVVAGEWKK